MTTDSTSQSARRSRQAELVNGEILELPVTIIGCGAIGSFTALTLAKMGFHDLTVYDGDQVSEENISNQFYRYSDIGTYKAAALIDMLQDFEGVLVEGNATRWTSRDSLGGYVISAVDSMTTRKAIYDTLKRNSHVLGFLDGRMGGQQAELYTIDPRDPGQRAIYERYLWTEEEASELRCTQKAVMYNVLWIASSIANTLRLMAEGKPYHQVVHRDFENATEMIVRH